MSIHSQLSSKATFVPPSKSPVTLLYGQVKAFRQWCVWLVPLLWSIFKAQYIPFHQCANHHKTVPNLYILGWLRWKDGLQPNNEAEQMLFHKKHKPALKEAIYMKLCLLRLCKRDELRYKAVRSFAMDIWQTQTGWRGHTKWTFGSGKNLKRPLILIKTSTAFPKMYSNYYLKKLKLHCGYSIT